MAFLLTYPIFTEIILPFLLVFVLIFAILQKSKLLGEGKMQIDAIIGFVVAAIVVTFANIVDIINQMTIIMAVALIVIFVFMLLYGFISGDTKGDPFADKKWLKVVLGLGVIGVVIFGFLYVSGLWEKYYDTELLANVLFVAYIVGAIIAVIKGGKKD